MDVAQYYVTTLTNAATKIGPILILLVVGYFVFIKLPFLFLVKVNKDNKPKEEAQKDPQKPEIKSNADEKIKLSAGNYDERLQKAREEKLRKQKEREEERPKQEAPKKSSARLSPAEELFEFTAGETFTKSELKKRYHELLKQNHPDKVASLGSDFKKLAEKKTKDINTAYEELKKKAA